MADKIEKVKEPNAIQRFVRETVGELRKSLEQYSDDIPLEFVVNLFVGESEVILCNLFPI